MICKVLINKLVLSEAEEIRYFGEVIERPRGRPLEGNPCWDDFEPFLYEGLIRPVNSLGVKRFE